MKEFHRERRFKSLILFLLGICLFTGICAAKAAGESYQFERMWDQKWYFSSPADVAVDSSGNVYVADAFPNDRIQKFDSNGISLTQWGSSGSGNGQFNVPSGIAIDSSGHMYVADYKNNRIQKFDSNGTYLTQWGFPLDYGWPFFPKALAADASSNIYVTGSTTIWLSYPWFGYDVFLLVKFDSSGAYLTHWGSITQGDGQFSNPLGITADASSNVYVADSGHDQIQKFDSNGVYLGHWGSKGSGEGQFSGPSGVSVNLSGNVYVADTGNHRIQKFDSKGTFLTQWGSYGTGKGQFNNPQGVAVDASGNVYVADTGNHRIQKFILFEFSDVPAGYWAGKHIYKLFDAEMTAGCGNNNFCPDNPVTRAQMAVFIETSLGVKTAPACTGSVFTDVDAQSVGAAFCRFIEDFAAKGITGGCGGGNFCPADYVTRAQMAVFLTTALGHSPGGCTGTVFSDVSAAMNGGEPFCWFIEKFASLGITGGCGSGKYCPNDPVTRAQMAVFLSAGFLH